MWLQLRLSYMQRYLSGHHLWFKGIVHLSWMCGREIIVELSHYFCFFAHKKFSRSFIKLQMNHWCHMDYFNDVLTTFLGLECGSCIAIRVRKLSDFIKTYRNLCFKDERRSYRFGKTWGWVINDRILIFGWTTPLILTHNVQCNWNCSFENS